MAGKGRPGLYKKKVEPYLSEIAQMALTMTEEQIAKTLGVGWSTFRGYKQLYPALTDALKSGRAKLVMELKSAMIQRAKGFSYEERKRVVKNGVVVQDEIYTKAALPDVASMNLLLKNYDKDNWANDPQTLELKRQELELQKLKIEEGSWS